MEYMTAEVLLYNYEPEENLRGDSFSGGAAKRLFASREGKYNSEDEEGLKDRVNTYESFTPTKLPRHTGYICFELVKRQNYRGLRS